MCTPYIYTYIYIYFKATMIFQEARDQLYQRLNLWKGLPPRMKLRTRARSPRPGPQQLPPENVPEIVPIEIRMKGEGSISSRAKASLCRSERHPSWYPLSRSGRKSRRRRAAALRPSLTQRTMHVPKVRKLSSQPAKPKPYFRFLKGPVAPVMPATAI